MHIIEILTIGLPFCSFKIITGLLCGAHWLTILGLVDLVINLLNLMSLMILKRRLMDACLLSLVIRKIKRPELDVKPMWQDLGNSLDVFLSFSIVAFMIAGNHLKEIPSDHMTVWNLSVILNVLGAGLGRVKDSLRNLRKS
jgi:hypothetical protein